MEDCTEKLSLKFLKVINIIKTVKTWQVGIVSLYSVQLFIPAL